MKREKQRKFEQEQKFCNVGASKLINIIFVAILEIKNHSQLTFATIIGANVDY